MYNIKNFKILYNNLYIYKSSTALFCIFCNVLKCHKWSNYTWLYINLDINNNTSIYQKTYMQFTIFVPPLKIACSTTRQAMQFLKNSFILFFNLPSIFNFLPMYMYKVATWYYILGTWVPDKYMYIYAKYTVFVL